MNKNFKIKINGKAMTVKMTLGLLHEVCSTIGHVELLAEAGYNPEIRHDLLVTLLSPRDEEGEITEAIKVKTLDGDAEEMLGLIDWAAGHAADFLLKTLHRSRKLLETNKDLLAASMPT